jgi:hypothetical protein
MAHDHGQRRKLNPSILLENVEALGKRFRAEHLDGWKSAIPDLEADWFLALHFLFERTFMRGRRDELSNVFLSFTIERLRDHFRPSSDLDEAYRLLLRHYKQGHLNGDDILAFKKQLGSLGKKGCIKQPAFQTEIADFNPIVNLLTTTHEVTVTWPTRYQKETRLSNDKDLLMVLGILNLVCQADCQNVYLLLMNQIEIEGPKAAYNSLTCLHEVGDKLAAMTIRDLGMMHPSLISQDFEIVFPVDTWVRRTSRLLGCDSKNDIGIKRYFIRECQRCGVDVLLFAAGMWYLGANALDVLTEEFLGSHQIADR